MTGMLVLSCLCLWHMFGVFDFQTDGVKTVSGTEGDSVTLHTGLTEVVGRDVILWTSLGYNIARFNRAAESISTLDGPDGIFKNRLRVTFLTGDLTISDLTTKHSGLYDVKIMQGSKVSYKRYKVEVHGVFGVDPDKVKSVSVMEGDSVTLHTDETEILRDDDVLHWMFGAQNPDTVIAQINREANITSIMDEQLRFRLQLNNQTGDLTITNITTAHTGLYKVQISRNTISFNIFNVTVYARLPVPVIIRDSSQCSSSSKCVLVCSVVNVTQVTLSWYKGNSLLSSISVSDLNRSLSLHLEVEYQENNIYSCVINNPIRNQTKHLNITEVCQPCSGDCVHCCAFTEAVIRLVLSALVGVASVAVLVYDITSRSDMK
ncbi:hepatocyte cell adhesion molecule-like isoform X1 [Xyrauchen texanus]|uniref:hepatocyte cell adhesion molecule-like isoform X1 n=1 Tax=Xyrauchen texanus TaxID=154827 RepID=UPI002242A6C8|nr:hepatocyte cell adhesion molecule-like isoform X1 [Xyrauchen texanus]